MVNIHLKENGPIVIMADEIYVNMLGHIEKLEGEIRLCRCGKSELIFCDGSHQNLSIELPEVLISAKNQRESSGTMTEVTEYNED